MSIEIKKVTNDCNLNYFTFWTWENGQKVCRPHNLYILAKYYDNHWGKKYKIQHPKFDGVKVERISVDWFLTGYDADFEIFKQYIKIIEDDYRQRELNLLKRINELENKYCNRGVV